jgi:hypothetical protein
MGGIACFAIGRNTGFEIGKNTYCVSLQLRIESKHSPKQHIDRRKRL